MLLRDDKRGIECRFSSQVCSKWEWNQILRDIRACRTRGRSDIISRDSRPRIECFLGRRMIQGARTRICWGRRESLISIHWWLRSHNRLCEIVKWRICYEEMMLILRMEKDNELFLIGEKILVFWTLTRHHWHLICHNLNRDLKNEKLEFLESDHNINPQFLLELNKMYNHRLTH